MVCQNWLYLNKNLSITLYHTSEVIYSFKTNNFDTSLGGCSQQIARIDCIVNPNAVQSRCFHAFTLSMGWDAINITSCLSPVKFCAVFV